jgi:hypothetical protein
MRLHENAIRASTVPTSILCNKEFSDPRPWDLPEPLKMMQEMITALDEEYERWLQYQYDRWFKYQYGLGD